MTETIKEITDPSFRTGTGAKGAWTLAKVKTDKGNEATAFMPIAVGDEVELVYNAQYKNYSAKKAKVNTPQSTTQAIAKNEQLDRIEQKLDSLLRRNQLPVDTSKDDRRVDEESF